MNKHIKTFENFDVKATRNLEREYRLSNPVLKANGDLELTVEGETIVVKPTKVENSNYIVHNSNRNRGKISFYSFNEIASKFAEKDIVVSVLDTKNYPVKGNFTVVVSKTDDYEKEITSNQIITQIGLVGHEKGIGVVANSPNAWGIFELPERISKSTLNLKPYTRIGAK